MVYLRLRVGSKVIRLSTFVKVKAQYWSKREGRIIIPSKIGEIDTILLRKSEEMLNYVKSLCFQDFSLYFCSDSMNEESIHTLILNQLKNNIANMGHIQAKRKRICIISLMREMAQKRENEKTQRNIVGIISNFKRFLDETNLEDSIESINLTNIRRYREWLITDSGVGNARGHNCLNYVLSLLNEIEARNGYDFKISRGKIEPIKEKRSMEERRRNGIALTEEEIERLKTLDLHGKLEVARDIFLLQCYCGFRFEDLSRFLESKHLEEREGIKYAVFETQKKDIISHTPLNNPEYYPQAYPIYIKYMDNSPYTEKDNDKYNKAIREVARLANLDREFNHTSTREGRKIKKNLKVYEKISSHSGRHTFITNCLRYRHIEPNVLIHITGHADSKMIETVYCNLQEEDKARAVHNAKRKDVDTTSTKGNPNNYEIEGREEAKRVLCYLGVEFNESASFEELLALIQSRQLYIADNYGINIMLLKSLFNCTLPLEARRDLLNTLFNRLLDTRKKG